MRKLGRWLLFTGLLLQLGSCAVVPTLYLMFPEYLHNSGSPMPLPLPVMAVLGLTGPIGLSLMSLGVLIFLLSHLSRGRRYEDSTDGVWPGSSFPASHSSPGTDPFPASSPAALDSATSSTSDGECSPDGASDSGSSDSDSSCDSGDSSSSSSD
jgi:hypothetical protein